ncbi:hypothetical protein B7L88_gp104 [Rhizobium phage RHEph10]|uniref:hypothetical protein n=1 Tax=Rhizobium phage RHEph10 TaxID=1220717 RepID=UPI0002AB63F7|nr:hypothetical protein B7L88_gp104 [Rhizobium phage RHEph10]AGC36184.1 hypothetical protein RHEph10_gp141 [Rhizobium phage RHEph10]
MRRCVEIERCCWNSKRRGRWAAPRLTLLHQPLHQTTRSRDTPFASRPRASIFCSARMNCAASSRPAALLITCSVVDLDSGLPRGGFSDLPLFLAFRNFQEPRAPEPYTAKRRHAPFEHQAMVDPSPEPWTASDCHGTPWITADQPRRAAPGSLRTILHSGELIRSVSLHSYLYLIVILYIEGSRRIL